MSKPKLENLTYEAKGQLETIPCPLCKSERFKTQVVEWGLPVVKCVNCSLTFANPRPNAKGLDDFYQGYFPPESEGLWQEQMAGVFLKEGLYRIREFQAIGLIEKKKDLRVLDVGCGMGFFLDLMRQEGCATKGVEPSHDAVTHARVKLKLDVEEGLLESTKIQGPFDIVTLWYVMEHVPNPHEILDQVSSLLAPGGLVIIRVPNQNVPIDRILSVLGLGKFFLMNPPRHLFDYSPKTMTGLLESRGLEVIKIFNGTPRGTGTWLELLRRHLWYWTFEMLYQLTGGRVIRGSSMTVYARKK